MSYAMPLATTGGTRYFLAGTKVIRDDRGFDAWADTTTLFVTLHRGADAGGEVVGRGVLTIAVDDFLRQLRTMKATNAASKAEGLWALARFGRFLAGELFTAFGGVLAGAGATCGRACRRCISPRRRTAGSFALRGTEAATRGRSSCPTGWGTRA